MQRSWKTLGGFFLAALLFGPAWGSVTPQPGTLNYIEGQAAIGSGVLTQQSVGAAQLAAGQSLTTANGRAEILLTPGVFLRLDDNSALRMVNPGLADTIMTLEKGRAIVDVTDIRPANNIRVNLNGATAQLLKPGLYDFDAAQGTLRVFDGKALVLSGAKHTDVGRSREILFQPDGKLKDQPFNRKKSTDDFYRWASLRSSYLAEANVNAAQAYAGDQAGWYPGSFSGEGWYWDPWFGAYTFLPGDGIFFDPFGWGFYSPWYAPYGGGFYAGQGYGGLPYHHAFGPGYHPPATVAGNRAAGVGAGAVGHAYAVRGGSAAAMSRGGSFSGSSVARDGGFGGGGVRAGGGFAGGGMRGGGGGGGFHGGGGGGGGHR